MIDLFHYPHYTLEQVSTAWEWETDSIEHYPDLEKFEHEMIQFMHNERGLGLAANQIGITKRFFAIGHKSFDTITKPAIIYNPKIIKSSKEKVMDVEGCLSFMGVWVKVERPKKVEVQYELSNGQTHMHELDGMESKCFQHELDHLDGITFNKRVSKLRWDMAKKRASKEK
jgi:peptide deformylase